MRHFYIGIGIGHITLSLVILKFLLLPYIWLCMLWSITVLFFAVSNRHLPIRLFLVYLSVTFFTFSIYETFLWIQVKQIKETPTMYEEFSQKSLDEKHDVLGYAPYKNMTVSHLRKHNNVLDFRVVYTIDSKGLRITPECNTDCTGSILFFGCSLTFGTGVEDHETLPYKVSIGTQRKYHVHNFGYRGYGPHQMLAALEHGLVEPIVENPPEYVIYQTFPDHIRRAAGLAEWDSHGPKYILNTEGTLLSAGHFDDSEKQEDTEITLSQRVKFQLIKSLIIKKILDTYQFHYQVFSEAHIRLFVEIVNYSQQIIQARYPHCNFEILFWDSEDRISRNIEKKLKGKGLHVHLMSNILPDYQRKRLSDYSLSLYDTHPSALAYQLIADYVINEIIEQR